jgi:Spy/CpxP family protein refolding chaperone
MKRVLCLGALAFVVACSDVTGPADELFVMDESAGLAYDAGGVSGPGRLLSGLHRLPANLKLSASQEASIKALLDQHEAATRADRAALAAINTRVQEARRAGKTRQEIQAILAEGTAIRARLEAAEAALQSAIEAVLTAEQKAWLNGHSLSRCNRQTAPPLTDAQKSEIQALIAAFETSHEADLDALKAALARARDAQRSGATREQLKAIMDGVNAARERVRTAQLELQKQIDAVLTAEQRASGCYRGLAGLPHPKLPGRRG